MLLIGHLGNQKSLNYILFGIHFYSGVLAFIVKLRNMEHSNFKVYFDPLLHKHKYHCLYIMLFKHYLSELFTLIRTHC